MANINIQQRNELIGLIATMFQATPGRQAFGDVVAAFEAGSSLKSIAEALSTKALFNDVYAANQTADQFATSVVAWLFPASTPAGAVAWSKGWIMDRLAEGGGRTPTDSLKAAVLLEAAEAMMATANPNYADAQALMLNRIAVSTHYSVTQMQPTTTLPELQAVLDGVTADPASVQAAKDAIDDNLASESFTLTNGIDTFIGGAGNDVFTARYTNNPAPADNSTLTASDRLDGGKGNDTLNIYANGGSNDIAKWPANATVTNIETITINSASSLGRVDASRFEGATTIRLIDYASSIINLGAGTIAEFAIPRNPQVGVTTAPGVTSATVRFTNLDDTKLAVLNVVSGSDSDTTKIDTIVIRGNVINGDETLHLRPLDAAATLTLDSSVDIWMSKYDLTSETLDASASKGGITLDEFNRVARDISTGSGNDVVTGTIALTSAKNSASLDGGAGEDKMTVTVTGMNASSVLTVNGGAGDDELTMEAAGIVAGTTLTVNAGEGDDLVNLTTPLGTLSAGVTKLNGGEGSNDVVRVNNVASVLPLDPGAYDYLNQNLTGFERVEFSNSVNIDASRLSDYAIGFLGPFNTASNVASNQEVFVAGRNKLTISGADVLNITTSGGTIIVNNDGVVNLTGGGATLKGSSTDAFVTLTVRPPPGAEHPEVLRIDTDDNVNLTTLTVYGDGGQAAVRSSVSALVDIDTSGSSGGLFLLSSQTKSETISLGDGPNEIVLVGTNVGAIDTIANFDPDRGDMLELGELFPSDYTEGVMNIGALTGSGTLDQLLSAYADTGAHEAVVFTFDGNTYVYGDIGIVSDATGQGLAYEDSDVLVKFIGTSYDLDKLADAISIALP